MLACLLAVASSGCANGSLTAEPVAAPVVEDEHARPADREPFGPAATPTSRSGQSHRLGQISTTLAQAYRNNATLNSARAGARVTHEDVAIAKSRSRPTVLGSASLDYLRRSGAETATGSVGVHVEQMLFDGFQTRNSVLSADARVQATHEGLRSTEQNILFDAAAAYVDVIRDRRVAALRESSISFLDEQIRAATVRLEAGEATVTDLAQAKASRAAALAQLSTAKAQVSGSAALYRQIVGEEPGRLSPVKPVAGLLPESLDEALSIATERHPAIAATNHMVDASSFAVKAAEGALLPQVSAHAGLSTTVRETVSGLPGVGERDGRTNAASVGLNLTIPIYQGGRVSAQVRQEKERLGQARIEVDVVRDQVRQAVVSAWAQYLASRQSVAANRQLVAAAQIALRGVIEERDAGQRTTLDVLNAQSDLINAQINSAHAERDVVAASYAILSAIGHLTVEHLGIETPSYRPDEHYALVKDKWVGVTPPDGR